MSQTGPWSVKGIDHRAREAAREAAGAEGMTLGEYINRLLLNDSPEEETPAVTPAPTAVPRGASSIRHNIRDLANDVPAVSLDQLTRRIEATEARSTLAITGMDQTVLGLVARLENAEQSNVSIAGHVDGLITELQDTHASLQDKVTRLEGDDSAAQNLEALKSLEHALGKLASHVYEENELSQSESEAIKGRVESGFEDIIGRVEGMEVKVEQTLGEAAQSVQKAVGDAEARAAGNTQQLSDRMSSIEETSSNSEERLRAAEDEISKALDASKTTNDRIESVEADVSERVFLVETSTSELADQVEANQSEISKALSSFEKTSQRIDETATDVAKAQSAADTNADRLDAVEIEASNIASSLEAATSRLDSVETDISKALSSFETATGRLDGVEADVTSALGSMESTLGKIQDRLNRAESTTDVALKSLEQSFSSLDERIEAVAASVDSDLAEKIRNEFNARFEDINASVRESIELARTQMAGEIERATQTLDDKIMVAETNYESAFRDAQIGTGDTDAIKDQINQITEDVAAKIDTVAETVDERVRESETRSAEAIEQVGEQVATVAARLQQHQQQAFERIQSDIVTSKQTSDTRLRDAMSKVNDRLEMLQQQSLDNFSPVQKAIATLASRLEDIEQFQKPQNSLDSLTPIEMPSVAMTPIAPINVAPAAAAPTTFTTPMPPLQDPFAVQDNTSGKGFEAGVENWEVTPEVDKELKADFAAIKAAAEVFEKHNLEKHDYVADIPEELDDEILDPLSMLSGDNHGAAEVRESDVFDTFVADTNDTDVEVTSEDLDGSDTSVSEPEELDLIARARNAAKSAAAENDSSRKKGRAKKKAGDGSEGANKLPLYAAASALIVGGAAYVGYNQLRGKQASPIQPTIANVPTLNGTPAIAAAAVPELADIDSTIFGDRDSSQAFDNDTVNTDDIDQDILFKDAAYTTDTNASAAEPTILAATPKDFPLIPIAQTLETAAETGDAVAKLKLGEQLLTNGRLKEGAELIQSAATIGLAPAQYRLSKLHETGLGVPKDLELARQWTERAAQLGNTKAMHDLAVFMADGDGGPQSMPAAVEWFRKAARFGIVDSQYNLAVCYEKGLGITKDLGEALYWYDIAARNGDASAPARVRLLSDQLTPEIASRSKIRASSWAQATASDRANGVFGEQVWERGAPEQTHGVQVALNALGFEIGEVDGIQGVSTTAAIKSYQANNGLVATGRIDNNLVESLNARASELSAG